MMNRNMGSDSFIVSWKPLNKIGDNTLMAEKVEKMRLAKRNPFKQNKSQPQDWGILQNDLDRNGILYIYASLLKAGALCISSASWDLCGGGEWSNRHSYRDQCLKS